jgi:hyperosmotically inducible protein
MKIPLLLLIPLAICSAQTQTPAEQRIYKEVTHELLRLPYLSIFDNLAYRVQGDTVTLAGQVTRPDLKPDAEKLVRHVEGVETVVNQIEVLPLSPNDQRIRRATYDSIARNAQLQSYVLQAYAPIRIIVKNGNVTLLGAVSNQADYNLLKLTANSVPGIFSLTDNLTVATPDDGLPHR